MISDGNAPSRRRGQRLFSPCRGQRTAENDQNNPGDKDESGVFQIFRHHAPCNRESGQVLRGLLPGLGLVMQLPGAPVH